MGVARGDQKHFPIEEVHGHEEAAEVDDFVTAAQNAAYEAAEERAKAMYERWSSGRKTLIVIMVAFAGLLARAFTYF